ncbi:MAG: HD domain-containing protein [Flavobacteriales bacterium]|mgnify:FL=1|nr:HD domain-containing protein [Flavobacteriales bacterium]
MQETKKNKIINDPIYGFITLERGIVFDLIEHPFFQRLRRITQLGLSYLVYPGAYHTRFHHALGCMFLMEKAILQIRNKGHEISFEEEEALKIAILLHDIGHGPFSHALENSIANNISHEDLSKLFMAKLNKEFDGKLSLAIQIFNNKHSKKFLHQLVSSQLDMDRLDYLKRDSFFTGVTEGNIGTERIINMLNVVNDQLVIEEKGIYSIEKFLIARRLMYWQVYLHKTVVSAENTLIKILKRAKQLIQNGTDIFSSSALKMFLKNNYTADNFIKNDDILEIFSKLDDHDIYSCLKEWANHDDFILSSLSIRILNRKPLKIKTQNEKFLEKEINKLKQKVSEKYNISIDDTNYLVFTGKVSNNAYQYHKTHINILMKNGEIKDITDASDQFNIDALSKTVNKYFLCYPKM